MGIKHLVSIEWGSSQELQLIHGSFFICIHTTRNLKEIRNTEGLQSRIKQNKNRGSVFEGVCLLYAVHFIILKLKSRHLNSDVKRAIGRA